MKTILFSIFIIFSYGIHTLQAQNFNVRYDPSAEGKYGWGLDVTAKISLLSEDKNGKEYAVTLLKANKINNDFYYPHDKKYYSSTEFNQVCGGKGYDMLHIELVGDCGGKRTSNTVTFSNLNEQKKVKITGYAMPGGGVCTPTLDGIVVRQDMRSDNIDKAAMIIRRLKMNQSNNQSNAGQARTEESSATATSGNTDIKQTATIEERYAAVGMDPNEDYAGNTVGMAASMISGWSSDAQARRDRKKAHEEFVASENRKRLAEGRKKGSELIRENIHHAKSGKAEAFKKVLMGYDLMNDYSGKKQFLNTSAFTDHNPIAIGILANQYEQTIVNFKRKHKKNIYSGIIYTGLAAAGGVVGTRILVDQMRKEKAGEETKGWIGAPLGVGLVGALISGIAGISHGIDAIKGYKKNMDYQIAVRGLDYFNELETKRSSMSVYPIYDPLNDTYALGLRMVF